MQTICVSLGGSVVSNEKGLNIQYLKEFRELLKKHKEMQFAIIVGGGFVNRKYIEALREEGVSEFALDEIGIAFTRVNALAAKSIFKGLDGVFPSIAEDIKTLKEASKNRIIFCSGFMPGITTDAVSIITCETLGSKKLINVSAQSGIYDKDPKEAGAKKFSKITHQELIELAEKYDSREAKAPFVFDLVASKLAKRSNIRIDFIGTNLNELNSAISNKSHNGTIVED
ncbi:MAG: UMP kinase [Candidatus Acidifodinimicrobium sp.]